MVKSELNSPSGMEKERGLIWASEVLQKKRVLCTCSPLQRPIIRETEMFISSYNYSHNDYEEFYQRLLSDPFTCWGMEEGADRLLPAGCIPKGSSLLSTSISFKNYQLWLSSYTCFISSHPATFLPEKISSVTSPEGTRLETHSQSTLLFELAYFGFSHVPTALWCQHSNYLLVRSTAEPTAILWGSSQTPFPSSPPGLSTLPSRTGLVQRPPSSKRYSRIKLKD